MKNYSVRQRVRPLVDTPGEENSADRNYSGSCFKCWRTINTTTSALFWNVRPLFDRSSGTVFGLLLANENPQEIRPKLVTMTGRSPWIVEGSSKLLNFLHPQSNQIRLWTLPTTESFERNCLKLDHPEKSWVVVYLYLCMGWIMTRLISRSFSHSEFLRDWCFGICCRQMEAFSNIFSETSLLSSCRFSCLTKTEVDTGFYDRIQRSSSTSSHEMFDHYFSSFGSTDTYILSAFRSLGLSRNRRLGDQWQPATIGGNCRSTASGRILFKNLWYLLLNIYGLLTIRTFGPQQQVFFMVLLRFIFILYQQIPKMKLGYRLWHFSAVESQLPDPQMTKPTLISVLRKAQKYALVGIDQYSKLVGISC